MRLKFLPHRGSMAPMRKRLFLCLWLAMAPWVQAADNAATDTATIDITIDLRDETDAARFDPARDRVGVRGGGGPLSSAFVEPREVQVWLPPGYDSEPQRRYLVQELKPVIDVRYRTQPGRESTAVGGSSFGGLVSMWLVLHHGDVFGAALVVSPSTWWAQGSIVADVQAAPTSTAAPRLWLDAGTEEGRDMVPGARRLRQALQARGWAPTYLEQAGAGHDETSWAARVDPMLRFLDAGFPPAPPVQARR
jgi:pimeloyl-ACP methyl ester carboxylesterase